MKTQWTPEQFNAITATRGTLLVSAAAGSGKTAVLVERVIRRLTDRENPCAADSLLIVTFTKAAAAQMRERVNEALAELVTANPADKWLAKQQMLLPYARICTIDSFCNELVRENFHRLDLNPDYRILDESEIGILKEEAASRVMEALYEENAPATVELVELLIQGNDDGLLKDSIVRLYSYSRAFPFPDAWLRKLAEPFERTESLKSSVWGRLLFDNIIEGLENCLATNRFAAGCLNDDPEIAFAYGNSFAADTAIYQSLLETVKTAEWDAIRGALQTPGFGRIGNAPRGYVSPVKDYAQNIRAKLKKNVGTLAGLLAASEEEHAGDMAYLRPIVGKLIEAVTMFNAEFSRIKSEANGADFSDIAHKALELLVVPDGEGRVAKTPLAVELSERYTEILVDEYQDINEAQDMLFWALSKNEGNLFMVGDVKQSIYRFRQAMPEIFLKRRGSLPEYADGNYPALVTLGSNFRSRRGVTGAVNFIFSQLMSDKTGELNYDEKEKLVPAAAYSEKEEPDAELHILRLGENEDEEKTAAEAKYIAGLINGLMASGFTVKGKNGDRPAEFRDFCVLMRSPRNRSSVFTDEFAKQNIPAYSDLSGGFFEAKEVGFMLSLLRVLDNPLQDVPMLTVLLSPVFGVTPDELAGLRVREESASLYECLLSAANRGDQKSGAFLEKLQELRSLASTLSAGTLVSRLLEETGYLAIAGALSDGRQRRLNLHRLLDYANQYEAAGHIGLTGFIRFIDKLDRGSGDLSPAVELSEAANVVRIMSVHKSKGLEFPVCILANCSAAFNDQSQTGNIVINPRAGIGLCRRDIATFRRFDTVSHKAASLAVRQDERSEELRVLYVALTRAKEKLITVVSAKEPDKKLSKLAGNILGDAPVSPFVVRSHNSFADWLLTAALRHPDASALRNLAGTESLPVLPADFRLKIEIATSSGEPAEETVEETRCLPDPALAALIEERLSYAYPYEGLTGVVAKQAASGLGERGINREYFASSRPAFMNTGGLTPAEKGIALHKFMQFTDYAEARANAAVELERLVRKGFLSGQEACAVDLDKIAGFFRSGLANRIFEAEAVMREKKFAVRVPARELYPELPEYAEHEAVVVQGIADCVFIKNGEIVVVDYKNDTGVSLGQLAARYAPQLGVYKRALSECLGLPVSEALIYSFEAQAAVAV